MHKHLLLLILLISSQLLFGQDMLFGSYRATVDLSDSAHLTILLKLKTHGNFIIASNLFNSFGNWKKKRNIIKLKSDSITTGCFTLDKKNLKFQIEDDRLIWRTKKKINKKKIERETYRALGERVYLQVQVTKINSIIFNKIYQED